MKQITGKENVVISSLKRKEAQDRTYLHHTLMLPASCSRGRSHPLSSVFLPLPPPSPTHFIFIQHSLIFSNISLFLATTHLMISFAADGTGSQQASVLRLQVGKPPRKKEIFSDSALNNNCLVIPTSLSDILYFQRLPCYDMFAKISHEAPFSELPDLPLCHVHWTPHHLCACAYFPLLPAHFP